MRPAPTCHRRGRLAAGGVGARASAERRNLQEGDLQLSSTGKNSTSSHVYRQIACGPRGWSRTVPMASRARCCGEASSHALGRPRPNGRCARGRHRPARAGQRRAGHPGHPRASAARRRRRRWTRRRQELDSTSTRRTRSDESETKSAGTSVAAAKHGQFRLRGGRRKDGTDGAQFGDELLVIGTAD